MRSAWFYDCAVDDFARGDLDWERAPVNVMLVTDDYQPSQATDETVANVKRFEVEPSGVYQAGGVELPDREVVRADPGGHTLDAGLVEWDTFTGQFRYAVAYRHDTGRLIGCADMGRQQATDAKVTIDYGRDGFGVFANETAF